MKAQNYDMEALRDAIRNNERSVLVGLDSQTFEWLEDRELELEELREEALETDNGINNRANVIAEETERDLDEVISELIAETMKELKEAGEFEREALEELCDLDDDALLNCFADEEFLEQFRK